MPSIRDYIDPGGRILASRLEQFCTTLECLGERLRNTLATILGDTMGGIVRDTALRVLDNFNGDFPRAGPTSSLPRDEFDPNDDDYYWGDQHDDILPRNHPDPMPRGGRLSTALSAGLQAASWWLRRCTGPTSAVTTVAVGLLAAGITYVGGPVAAVVLGLAGTATQFVARPDSIGADPNDPP